MVHPRKLSPRAEYRLQQAARINSSASLVKQYPKLKALRVDLSYQDADGTVRAGGMKYKVNLEHAKSRFCFNCVQSDCAGGDYDLSKQLAEAVSKKRKLVEGEMRCEGERYNKEKKSRSPCLTILRYRLTLGY